MKKFENKVVVITGAGSGMGRAFAVAFKNLGAKLALNDYDNNGLQETVKILNYDSQKIHAEYFDVSNKEAMYGFAENVKNKLGNAHVIINNAGIESFTHSVLQTPEAEYEKVMNINFYGVLYGTKAFLGQLIANDEGAIVNTSSIFGLLGMPNNSDYCASKFAVRGFTESLMVEMHGTNITVHSLHPGGINTNIARSEASKKFGKKYLTTAPEAIVDHVIKCIRKKQPKIVFGRDSFRVHLAANFVPKKIIIGILKKEFKRIY